MQQQRKLSRHNNKTNWLLTTVVTHCLVAAISFSCGRLFDSVCVPCEYQVQPLFKVPTSRMNGDRHRSTTDNKHYHESSTVEPATLPGMFANNSLYLQTIRLTKSFNRSIDDLHVDMFTFSGDLTRPAGEESPECKDVPEPINETLWGRIEIMANVTFFCQLDSLTIIHQSGSSYKLNFTHKYIRMFNVPSTSNDGNQEFGSPIVSRCNVTDIFNRSQLMQHIHDSDVADSKGIGTLSVRIWMQLRDEATIKLATFEIPLDTGTLGPGSTIVQGGVAKSYFHQPTVPVGHCLAIYKMRSVKYLPQFVQHHLNVGFGSIVIGILGPPESEEIKEAQCILRRYINEGLVTLAHYDAPFGPHADVAKLQFYTSCLFHYKGLTKYAATWDIDEFWLPPDILQVDGRHNTKHYKVEDSELLETDQVFSSAPEQFINASSWSKYAKIIRDDPLWQGSRYAQSVSIADTVNAIERYYDEHGCASSFCYHAFPSLPVLARIGREIEEENRATRISADFYFRATVYTHAWQKSFVNTQIAHNLGYHMGGSCFFERSIDASLQPAINEQLFHAESDNTSCYARLFENNVYGGIHHLFELIVSREPERGDNTTVPDEFSTIFAPIVEQQLERDDPHAFANVSIVDDEQNE